MFAACESPDGEVAPATPTAGPDVSSIEPLPSGSDGVVEPGVPSSYRLYAHCGHEWLGIVNGITWFTDEPMPDEWWALLPETETLELSILMETGDAPVLTATAAGVSVLYLPTSDPIPGCD